MKSVNRVNELTEKWVDIQKKWVYLENIFNSSDIRKQFNKNELALFEKSDKAIRGFIIKVNQMKKPIKMVKTREYIELLRKILE